MMKTTINYHSYHRRAVREDSGVAVGP
jgi:hypothetical protein